MSRKKNKGRTGTQMAADVHASVQNADDHCPRIPISIDEMRSVGQRQIADPQTMNISSTNWPTTFARSSTVIEVIEPVGLLPCKDAVVLTGMDGGTISRRRVEQQRYRGNHSWPLRILL